MAKASTKQKPITLVEHAMYFLIAVVGIHTIIFFMNMFPRSANDYFYLVLGGGAQVLFDIAVLLVVLYVLAKNK